MDPSSSNKPMEKPINPDPHPVNCPRCDSSNTKFCYYNNYSLSQPRHFCKACKRYWTRGGTLRSVPVGGSCRKKKKRDKIPPTVNSRVDGGYTAVTCHVQPSQIALSPVSNHMNNSLFYNIHPPTNNLELNFPFSRFSSIGVSSGFDFHQPTNSFGLGFSSGVLTSEDQSQGRSQDLIDQQDRVILGSAGPFGSTSTMTSLLASLQHQKPVANGLSGLMPYDHDMEARGGNGISNGREVKVEGENRLSGYQNDGIHDDQQINKSSDANSSLLWNTSNIGSWFDPPTNNLGSSVPSLI